MDFCSENRRIALNTEKILSSSEFLETIAVKTSMGLSCQSTTGVEIAVVSLSTSPLDTAQRFCRTSVNMDCSSSSVCFFEIPLGWWQFIRHV